MEKKFSAITSFLFKKPKVAGFLVFLFLTVMVLVVAVQRYTLMKENEQREMFRVLNVVKQRIDLFLRSSYTAAFTLGLSINGDGVPKNFDKVAAKIIEANPDFKAVQLVPGGVIKYIYPLKGNETALNANVFHSSKRSALEAKKAIAERRMYFAGPVKLLQGGIGVVGRIPLFLNNKFWGFSAVVMKLDVFLKQAGLNPSENNKFGFQLSKVNPLDGKEEFFLPQKKPMKEMDYETLFISDGNWKLYVIAPEKNEVFLALLPPVILGLVLAAFCGFLVYLLFKKPAELQLLVYEQASKLLENEIKFKTIFDQAAIGIAEVDSNTGNFIRVNDKLCRILGYTEEALLNRNFQSLTHPDDLNNNLSDFVRMRDGELREFELSKRYLHKEGHVVWVNLMITALWKEDNKPSSNIIIVEDVTQRKYAEQIAEEYQHRMASLINTIEGVVWESDPETFNFSFISEKSGSILGYKPEEWLASPTFWLDHIHPEDLDWVLQHCRECTEKLQEYDFEYRMLGRDGATVWLRNTVHVVTEEEKPVLLRGIMIDITRNKRAEKDLSDSFDLVVEQNKRLLNFSYIVSHNLRSHTSNIQAISTLIETTQSEAERVEMVELLKKVSTALNETLINLNKVVNIQTNINVIIEPLNLKKYVDKTLHVLNDQIVLKNANVINRVSDDVIVSYNPAYLESVLLNFIFNAIRYSHPERVPVVELICYQEDQLVLQIADNGIGMDLERYGDELFGMYKTFNGNPDSKGVGLFISKNQIEAMGGKVVVESIVNMGTTFRIYFK